MATESRSQSGGRICLKGQSGPQIVHDNKRITSPLKRVGPRGSGKWKTITWEEALGSEESLVPTKLAFGPMPVPPVAIPGTPA